MEVKSLLNKDTLVPIGSVIAVLVILARFSYATGVLTTKVDNLTVAVSEQSKDIKDLVRAVSQLQGKDLSRSQISSEAPLTYDDSR